MRAEHAVVDSGELDLGQGVGRAPGTMTLKDAQELAKRGGQLEKEGIDARMWEAPVIEKYCTCKEPSEVQKDYSLRRERAARDEAGRCAGPARG